MANRYYEGIGRRKRASARVRLFPGGNGNLFINHKAGAEFLPREGDVERLMRPLQEIGALTQFDVSVHVKGGGISGQRDAISLGIARALLKINPEYKSALKNKQLLTRDARVKERKKPGLKRARKAPTYTKR